MKQIKQLKKWFKFWHSDSHEYGVSLFWDTVYMYVAVGRIYALYACNAA